jgi:hypothetical protein
MGRLAELSQMPAEIFADRLHPEADTKRRKSVVQGRGDGFGNGEILRPARAGRQHQEIPVVLP